MPNTINVKSILYDGVVESSRIEYKKGFNPEEIIKTICAFANDIENVSGGYIFIGIEEKDGIPIIPPFGVEKDEIDNIFKEIINLCSFIQPIYRPIMEYEKIDNKYIIVIRVFSGYGRPYKAPKYFFKDKSNKVFFIRKGSTTVVATPDDEKELFMVSSRVPFDDQENLNAPIEALSLELMNEHLKLTNSNHQKCDNLLSLATDMRLIGDSIENIHPLNVGILMFSNEINKYFKTAYMDIVKITDEYGLEFIEKKIEGPIQKQLKTALLYIKDNIIEKKIFKISSQEEAIEIYNYPLPAIEEILTNAVYHKSYQIEEPITIRIEKKFIEITSCPGMDKNITDKKIEEKDFRSRVYRNRRIGDFLKELHLTEGRNTGFPTAEKSLKINGSKELQIIMDPNRTFLSVRIPIHESFIDKKDDRKISDYEEKIIELIKKENLTLTDLSKKMGYKSIPKKLSNEVEILIKSKKLKRTISSNGKIVLTLV